MNGVSPSTNKESPKTPGGISKSLLTPCRRVGLSRKWRKGGCSPFVSPLSTQDDIPKKTGDTDEKRRRKCDDKTLNLQVHKLTDEQRLDLQDSNVYSPISLKNFNESNELTSTPCRSNLIPRKKSKVRSLSLNNHHNDELVCDQQRQPNEICRVDETKIKKNEDKNLNTKSKTELKQLEVLADPIRVTPEENISKLVRTTSKNRKLSLKKSLSKTECNTEMEQSKSAVKNKPKENSPNNLTKECMVVIQNKILKTVPHIPGKSIENSLPESDTELEIPLSALKAENKETVTLNTLDDDDFIIKPVRKKICLSTIKKHKNTNPIESTDTSQSSQEDMDKRTILVKKTYEKVTKPQKAKSTGSITQKDIDEIKARIEMKKKLLLAKAMSIDTEELRDLVKKWQKGCQDALMELLDLMKKKLPDKQHMDYAEILQTLKIPAELVGYDSENDCFLTPDDTNILLSTFKL